MRQFILELCSYPEQKAMKVFEVDNSKPTFLIRKFDGEEQVENFCLENLDDFCQQFKDNVALTTMDGLLLLGYEPKDKYILIALQKKLDKIIPKIKTDINIPILCTRQILNMFFMEYSSHALKVMVDTYSKTEQSMKLKNGEIFPVVLQGPLKIILEEKSKEQSQVDNSKIVSSKNLIDNAAKEVVLGSAEKPKSYEIKAKSQTKEEQIHVVVAVPQVKEITKNEIKTTEKPTSEDFANYLQDETANYTTTIDYRH